MKPPRFAYHDPRSIGEVTELLSRLENARLLAGGQSLMPMLNMRYVLPDHVIDINKIAELAYLREDKGALELGAMTRQRDLEFSDVVRTRCPILHEAILQVGHRQTRNRGTVGGSLCHLDPSAEIVSVAAALDATVQVAAKKGTRDDRDGRIPAGLHDAGDRARRDGDGCEPAALARRVTAMPSSSSRAGTAISRSARRRRCCMEDGGGKITRASVTIGGVGPAPVRAREVEAAITGQAPSAALFREACESCRKIEAMSDVHAPADYRQHLAAVLSRRALEKAHQRVRAAG